MAEYETNQYSPPKEMASEQITFHHQEYKIRHQINERVFVYARYEGKPYTLLTDRIYYDQEKKIVLYQYIYSESNKELIQGSELQTVQ